MLEVGAELGGRAVDLADQERVAGRLAQRARAERRCRAASGSSCGGRARRRRAAPGTGTARPAARRRAGRGASPGGRWRRARNPSAPWSSQNRTTSCIASTTRISPVEVGLLGEERVQVPAPVARPSSMPARRSRPPVVGPGVGPDVAVGVLAKPGVLDRRVARDEVEQERDAAGVGRVGERPDVGDRAEARVDGREVGDVVAAVGERRRIERREPDRVDAELGEVVDPRERSRAGRRCRRRRSPGTSADRSGTPPPSPSPVQKRGQTPTVRFGLSGAHTESTHPNVCDHPPRVHALARDAGRRPPQGDGLRQHPWPSIAGGTKMVGRRPR